MASPKRRFNELLRDARVRADQSPEVMSILLNMSEEEYLAIEEGRKFPDNETLKRLCMMLEWNYYDTQRLIINEMNTNPQAVAPASQGEAALRALQSMPLEPAGRQGKAETLGSRLREVRTRTGQAPEIIALLLNIDVEAYQRLEEGDTPGDELLRRISMVYDWNYYDLIALLRSEQARALQPHHVGNPFPGASAHHHRLHGLVHEVESLFARLPERDQPLILAQLELIRETLRRQVAAPARPQGLGA